MPNHFYPQKRYVEKSPERAKWDRIKRYRGGSTLQKVALPKTLSLTILSSGEILGYLTIPYIMANENSLNETKQREIILSSLSLIIFNIQFLRANKLISLEPKNYVASRNALKSDYGYVHNLSKAIFCFSDEYPAFRKQIMDLLKNNMSFIRPTENDLPENISKIYREVFLNKNETIPENEFSFYNLASEDQKLHIQKIFSTLVYEYCKIRDNEQYLKPLYSEIRTLIKSPSIQI